jgi:hypothetical protein
MAAEYATARAIREQFEARLKQHEFEVRKGKYVDADQVKTVLFNWQRRCRDLLLAIPDRVAASVAAVKDEAECRRIVAEEIDRVCEELARVPRV